VPGHFESVEEYVRVFEPLLFEECRAQLYNTWEELTDSPRDAHTMVRVRTVERRERGMLCVFFIVHINHSFNKNYDFLLSVSDIRLMNQVRVGCVVQFNYFIFVPVVCNNWPIDSLLSLHIPMIKAQLVTT